MLRSECARQVGCSPETLRYYERIGLIDAPARSEAGYRHYQRRHLDQLNFIRTARELGFDLEAIGELLAMNREKSAPCDHADELVREHLAHIDARIQRFQQLRGVLAGMLADCPGDVVADCSVFRSLSQRHPVDVAQGNEAEPVFNGP